MKKIRLLKVTFNTELRLQQLDYFRGAVINASGGKEAPVLFHNHLNEAKYRRSYPLIQYKRHNNKAQVFCLEDGVDDVHVLFQKKPDEFQIGRQVKGAEIESIHASKYVIQIWDSTFPYKIRNWLALNSENYAKFGALESDTLRMQMLERILVGNILSFAKGIGWHVTKRIELKILSSFEPVWISYKSIPMLAFNCHFESNVSLPSGLGLGKGSSIGFGVVHSLRSKKVDDDI